jgi:hypothetical protein
MSAKSPVIMNPQPSLLLGLSTAAALLLGATGADAAISFVSVAADLGNISPSTSNEIVVGGNLKIDNKWGQRDGFGETGVTVLEAWDVEEDVPVLTMTLTGLTLGETYDVYVNYVRFTSNNDPRGGIRGSLDGSNFTLFNEPGGTPGAVGYAELTGFTNSDRVGVRGYLGTAIANASGEIAVQVDDDGLDGLVTERVWFDGASFELIPEPSVSLLSLGAVALLAGRRRRV